MWFSLSKVTFDLLFKKHIKKPLVFATEERKNVAKLFSGPLRTLPVSIFPSCAAGPSGITLFTCRNSSGSSPPMMVNPKPMWLFFRVVLRKVPFSWDASRVKSGFSTLANVSWKRKSMFKASSHTGESRLLSSNPRGKCAGPPTVSASRGWRGSNALRSSYTHHSPTHPGKGQHAA